MRHIAEEPEAPDDIEISQHFRWKFKLIDSIIIHFKKNGIGTDRTVPSSGGGKINNRKWKPEVDDQPEVVDEISQIRNNMPI